MVSDGIGGYHSQAEPVLLRGQGPGDVSACAVCGARMVGSRDVTAVAESVRV
jgi:hypothetical protein